MNMMVFDVIRLRLKGRVFQKKLRLYYSALDGKNPIEVQRLTLEVIAVGKEIVNLCDRVGEDSTAVRDFIGQVSKNDELHEFNKASLSYLIEGFVSLADKLEGTKPSLQQLLGVYVESNRAAFNKHPEVCPFKDESSFDRYLRMMEDGFLANPKKFMGEMLPVYEHFTKGRGKA